MSPDRPEVEKDDDQNWYSEWLISIAGGEVHQGPLILVWLALGAAIFGIGYLTGSTVHTDYTFPLAAFSGAYWFIGVPLWLSRRKRD